MRRFERVCEKACKRGCLGECEWMYSIVTLSVSEVVLSVVELEVAR